VDTLPLLGVEHCCAINHDIIDNCGGVVRRRNLNQPRLLRGRDSFHVMDRHVGDAEVAERRGRVTADMYAVRIPTARLEIPDHPVALIEERNSRAPPGGDDHRPGAGAVCGDGDWSAGFPGTQRAEHPRARRAPFEGDHVPRHEGLRRQRHQVVPGRVGRADAVREQAAVDVVIRRIGLAVQHQDGNDRKSKSKSPVQPNRGEAH
jgi:hypothetical protein